MSRKPVVVRISQGKLQFWHVPSGAYIDMSPEQMQMLAICAQAHMNGPVLLSLSDALHRLQEMK